MIDVVVGGRRITLTRQLGVGGEAVVFLHGDHAIKIFHTIPPGTPPHNRRVLEAARDNKVRKLGDILNLPLPSEVLKPEFLTYDPHDGRTVTGFGMRAFDGDDLFKLADRSERQARGISNADVIALFRGLRPVIETLHRTGVVIGDFNSSNGLFRGAEVRLIDSDSYQFGPWRCTVGHEDFLDPRFYGTDLTQVRTFDEASDWYAMLVMVFVSLLYVHPYGGTHKNLSTQLRRAEARWSVLRPDVKYPKSASPFCILPDDFLHYCEAVFDRGERSTPPPAGLFDFRFTKCRCGLEHARAVCPTCAVPGVVTKAIRFRGKYKAETIHEARDGILYATAQDGDLRYLYREGSKIFREDGSPVGSLVQNDGARFAICGKTTWVGERVRDIKQISAPLLAVRAGAIAEITSASRFGNYAAFDATGESLYQMNGDWLVEHATGLQLGRALDGQTFVRAGEHIGFGFYRIGTLTMYFLFEPRKTGLTMVDSLAPIRGRLLDASVVFADRYALFNYLVEDRGKVAAHIYVLRDDGTVKSSLVGEPSSSRALASARGKMLLVAPGAVRILAPTDDGVLSLAADGAQIVEKTLFADTEPFVEAGSELLPGPGGSIYVVAPKWIQQLSIG